MPAGTRDLYIEQGSTFSITCQIFTDEAKTSPRNLTGYSGRGSIKLKLTDTTPLLNFTVTVTNPTQGIVTITLPANATTSLTIPRGETFKNTLQAQYDIELFTAGDADVIRLLNGRASISPEATK